MITVGIQPEREGFHTKWAEFLQLHGARVKWLDLLGPDPFRQVAGCDGVMWHWYHDPDHKQSARVLLQVIESELGIPTFPNSRTAWHFDDKIAQHYLFQALAIPTPVTWLFWDREQALKWLPAAPYPLVFKLATGAGSRNVERVPHARNGRRLVRRMFSRSGHIAGLHIPPNVSYALRIFRHLRNFFFRFFHSPAYVFLNKYPPLPVQYWQPEKNYILFQEFLPGNDFDTRITVIGNRAFGYRRMNRPSDFRASGSGVFDPDPDCIDRRCVRLAFASAAKLKMQSVAFDMLFKNKEPLILEISYAYVDWMVHACPGYWDADLTWHPGSLWPQEAHVVDLLAQIKSPRQSGSAHSPAARPSGPYVL